MRHYFAPRFERDYRKLFRKEQEAVDRAIETLLRYLARELELPHGLGMKRLAGDYWEIRTSLHTRIIFELADPIGFLLVGSHEDVKRFIKSGRTTP